MTIRHAAARAVLAALILLLPSWAVARPIYVPLGETNQIARIDSADARIEKLLGSVDNPHGLGISPDGRTLYAASLLEQVAGAKDTGEQREGVSEADHSAHHGTMAPMTGSAPRTYSFITKLNADTGEIERRIDVEKFTHHVTVTPDGARVIGVQSGAGRIVVIDAATERVLRYVPVGAAPNYALVTRDGARVFVSSAGTGTVTVLDGRSWRKLASVSAGGGPEHMVFSPDEQRLYVVNVASSELSIVDTASLKEIRRVPTGNSPHGVAFSRSAQAVVVSNNGADSLSVFDPEGELLQTVPLAPQPYHVAEGYDGSRLWVSSRQEGKLWRISTVDFMVSDTLEIPGIGHQIALVP